MESILPIDRGSTTTNNNNNNNNQNNNNIYIYNSQGERIEKDGCDTTTTTMKEFISLPSSLTLRLDTTLYSSSPTLHIDIDDLNNCSIENDTIIIEDNHQLVNKYNHDRNVDEYKDSHYKDRLSRLSYWDAFKNRLIGGSIASRLLNGCLYQFYHHSVFVLWLIVNICCLSISRQMEIELKFSFPISGMVIQMSMTGLLAMMCIYVVHLGPYNPLDYRDIVFKILPFTMLHSIHFVLSARITHHLVEFTRSFVPLITVLFQYLVLHIRFDRRVYISLMIFSTGISLFHLAGGLDRLSSLTMSDLTSSLILSTLLAFQSVYAHRLFSTTLKTIDTLTILFYFAPCSLAVIIPAAILFEGPHLINHLSLIPQPFSILSPLLISGFLTFLTFYSTFIINKKYDIITMAMARNTKPIAVKIMHSNGIISFLQHLNNFIGLLFCIYGIFSFRNATNSKDKDELKKDKEQEEEDQQHPTTI